MKLKQNAIIMDIDGTLANNEHRQHFLEEAPRNWKSFFANMILDTPNPWCKQLIFAMQEFGYHILFVTGRSDQYRSETEAWMRHHLLGMEKTKLYMRNPEDDRKDTIVKHEIYENDIRDNYQVLFCVDDRPSVCRMWRALGLTVLQCNDKEF